MILLAKDNNLLKLPELLYGTIKRVGILDKKPILYGDINLLKPNDLYYISGAKLVYRYIKSSIEDDIMTYYFDTIKSTATDNLSVPEDERGHIRNAGYLFNEIIYSGDANLIDNGSLFYHDTLPFVSVVSNVDGIINLFTKAIIDGDPETIVTEYRVSPEPHDYSKDYLTFEALEDGTFTLTISKDNYGGTLDITSISYSIDNGNNWVTTQRSANATTTITTPTITQGDKVLWKGIAPSFYNSSGPGITSIFSSTGKFNVYGNIMSLLYGDDFEDKIVIPGTEGNFGRIFENAVNLINAENLTLPATTLTSNCYYGMFRSCTSLITAPNILPATTLASDCYNQMFYNCTSLTEAPELPATTLAYNCYFGMFTACSNLNYIKAMFITEPSNSYTNNWVDGVATTGTFVKNSAATWNVTGTNGVPSDWVIVFWDTNYDYFTTEAIDDSVFTFSIPSDIPTSTLNYVEYSVDNGQTWIKTNNVDSTAVTITTPTITAGNSVKWRCAASAISTPSDHSTFSSSGRYNVSGNIMSLVSGASEFSPAASALRRLFYNSTNLVSAINLSLATTVANECYRQMFSGCTSLTTAPELPATTLRYNCYNSMFQGCTSLTTAPELPATALASCCYANMFQDCTSLTTAPELPVTTLVNSCYSGMFKGCTSLKTAPMLPATTLVNNCYNGMFQNCTNLNYIKAMFTTKPGNTYTYNWVNGVSTEGTFVKNSAATWNVTGSDGIPTGWTVETANADTNEITI